MSETIEVSKIRLDGGTQPRARLSEEMIKAFKEDMAINAVFPPVVVFFDGAHYWLADGFHRVNAHLQLEYTDISVEIHQGTQQDAQWYSYGANKGHGFRRTNEDKQRAVQAALRHPKSAQMSDALVAKHCGVSNRTVWEYRQALKPTYANCVSGSDPSDPETSDSSGSLRVCADGRMMNVSFIGRRAPAPANATDAPFQGPRDINGNVITEPLTRPPNPNARKFGDPWPPKKKGDITEESSGLARAIRRLSEHAISPGDFVSALPEDAYQQVHKATTAAMEFLSFVAERLGKKITEGVSNV